MSYEQALSDVYKELVTVSINKLRFVGFTMIHKRCIRKPLLQIFKTFYSLTS